MFLYQMNLEKNTGVSQGPFLSESFFTVIKLVLVGNNETAENTLLLLLYNKFTICCDTIILRAYFNEHDN